MRRSPTPYFSSDYHQLRPNCFESCQSELLSHNVQPLGPNQIIPGSISFAHVVSIYSYIPTLSLISKKKSDKKCKQESSRGERHDGDQEIKKHRLTSTILWLSFRKYSFTLSNNWRFSVHRVRSSSIQFRQASLQLIPGFNKPKRK